MAENLPESPRRGARAAALDLAAVGAGGAVGTALRASALMAFAPATGGVPWVTAGTNLLGAFLLGALVVRLTRRPDEAARLRLFLLPGLLGSFTTFSALAMDVVGLAGADGGVLMAAGYLVVSIPGGVLAGVAGLELGGRSRGVDARTES